MFFGEKHISKKLSIVSLNRLTFAFDPIYGKLCHLYSFENKPSEFSKLTRKVSRFVTEEKTAVYGLENAYGYGRTLAVWLLEKGNVVKDVNTSLSLWRLTSMCKI